MTQLQQCIQSTLTSPPNAGRKGRERGTREWVLTGLRTWFVPQECSRRRGVACVTPRATVAAAFLAACRRRSPALRPRGPNGLIHNSAGVPSAPFAASFAIVATRSGGPLGPVQPATSGTVAEILTCPVTKAVTARPGLIQGGWRSPPVARRRAVAWTPDKSCLHIPQSRPAPSAGSRT